MAKSLVEEKPLQITVEPTLRVLMAVANLEIGELAHMTGLSSQVISKAMKGKRISPDSAGKISSALGVPLSQIAGLNYEKGESLHD